MNLPKNTPELYMDSPSFAQDLANALGLKPGEKITIITPQFERTDGMKVNVPEELSPESPEDWASLLTKTKDELSEMGLGIWDSNDKGTHWLFPKEWYPIIPKGLMIKYIHGGMEAFEPGVTDDDYRCGCLAYGFFQPVKG